MARQGYDLQLMRYDEKGWRATFSTTGMEHSPTSATGTSWERTPWRATQRAAWDALRRDTDLTRRGRDLGTLQLPHREASRVKLIAVQSERRILSSELDLHIHLVALHPLATNWARQSAPTMSPNNAISRA